MKRTTISLPDDLALALVRTANRRSTSASAVARAALEQHLHFVQGEARPLPFANVGRSGQQSIARDMEDLIEREWDDDARAR
ncbi:MAG TPA: CopG family transcriptional regulator [Solirubrobacteraceae bacterium]|jgi:predicted transcriptional regulator